MLVFGASLRIIGISLRTEQPCHARCRIIFLFLAAVLPLSLWPVTILKFSNVAAFMAVPVLIYHPARCRPWPGTRRRWNSSADSGRNYLKPRERCRRLDNFDRAHCHRYWCADYRSSSTPKVVSRHWTTRHLLLGPMFVMAKLFYRAWVPKRSQVVCPTGIANLAAGHLSIYPHQRQGDVQQDP